MNGMKMKREIFLTATTTVDNMIDSEGDSSFSPI